MSVTGRPITRGFFARENNGILVAYFGFQFNPSKVDRNHSATYVRPSPAGSPVPRAHFTHINATPISLELLLDAAEGFVAEKQGVQAQQAELESYVQTDLDDFNPADDLGSFVAPPRVWYGMGPQVFPVTVDSVGFKDERWSRTGVVTRSRVSIAMTFSPADLLGLRTRLDTLKTLRDLVTVRA